MTDDRCPTQRLARCRCIAGRACWPEHSGPAPHFMASVTRRHARCVCTTSAKNGNPGGGKRKLSTVVLGKRRTTSIFPVILLERRSSGDLYLSKRISRRVGLGQSRTDTHSATLSVVPVPRDPCLPSCVPSRISSRNYHATIMLRSKPGGPDNRAGPACPEPASCPATPSQRRQDQDHRAHRASML